MPYPVRFSCCCNGYRGGSRIFFRRGCTRLELNKPHSFFGRIPVVLENCRSSRGGGGWRVCTPCTFPLDLPLVWYEHSLTQKRRVPQLIWGQHFFSNFLGLPPCATTVPPLSSSSLILQVHVPKTCTCQILLNESETCTVMKAMEEKLDGCYTKMLRMVFNVSWQDKLTIKDYMIIYHQCHQKWVSEGWS